MLGVRHGLVVLASVCVLATSCRNPTPETSSGAIPPPVKTGAPSSVNQVLGLIAASNVTFEYLEKDHLHVENGPELAESLRKRYSTAGSPEVTPDIFVTRFATWSDSSKAKYRVRLADGSHMELSEWLRQQMRLH